jgi:hypothetical protein
LMIDPDVDSDRKLLARRPGHRHQSRDREIAISELREPL